MKQTIAIKPTTYIGLLITAGWKKCSYSDRYLFTDKQGRDHAIILDQKRPHVITYHSLSIKETSWVYLVSGKSMYDNGGRSKNFGWYLKPENLETVIYNGRYKNPGK